MAVSGTVTHTKISNECIAKKRWLRSRDIPRIQKISDARTIKKRWLRDLFSHVHSLRTQKLYKDKPQIYRHKKLVEGSCTHARHPTHTKNKQ